MKQFIIVICLYSTFLSAQIFQNNALSIFTDEEIHSSSIGFAILDGTIKVDKLGGIADGEYYLEEWEIENIDNERYEATLHFQKKKGIVNYTHTERIGIFLSKNSFWLKYEGKIYKYNRLYSQLNNENFQNKIIEVVIKSMQIRFQIY